MSENNPPMSGLNVVDSARAAPASAMAPIGALTPATPAIGIASSPNAADMECCGLYHMDLDEAVDAQSFEPPVAHRVDVQVGQLIEWAALRHQLPPGIQSLGAGRDDRHHDGEGRAHSRERHGPRCNDERGNEEHTRTERVHLQRIFDLAQSADAFFADDRGHEEIRPVVPEWCGRRRMD